MRSARHTNTPCRACSKGKTNEMHFYFQGLRTMRSKNTPRTTLIQSTTIYQMCGTKNLKRLCMVDIYAIACVFVQPIEYLVSRKKKKKIMKEEALNVLVSCHNK